MDKKSLQNKKIKSVEDIKPYIDEILSRDIKSSEDLESLIKDYSLIMAFVSENIALAYIDMTCHATDKEKVDFFNNLYAQIAPYVEEKKIEFYKKIKSSPYWNALPEYYDRYKKIVESSLKVFNKENLKLMVEDQKLTTEYSGIVGGITVNFRGKEYTVQQMSVFLKDKDRETRKEAWTLITDKKREVSDKIANIYDKLVEIRHNMAKNAGFKNFIDYTFEAKHRFDYTKDDCLKFHKTVLDVGVPAYGRYVERLKKRLNVETVKPWDKAGTSPEDKVLKPFNTGKELLDAVIEIFDSIDRRLGDNLRDMLNEGLFDLETRKGKAPGGYNYPLELRGKPFIFMNSSGIHRDLVTLLHEGGHATHTYLSNHIPVIEYKEVPSEVAELASMSMELISMDKWNLVYKDENELKQAKREQIEGIISFFPWAVVVDRYQFFVYDKPDMTKEERNEIFEKLYLEYGEKFIDWSGIDTYKRKIRWQEQLHIIEVPFYYIEYAFSQLGAVQVWMNYKDNPQKALNDYLNALKLGNEVSIKEMYETAGISFDFSEELFSKVISFLENELENL